MSGKVIQLRELVGTAEQSGLSLSGGPCVSGDERVAAGPSWSRDELAGRMVEVSGQGAVAPLTAAVGLVVEAQKLGEPAAWVTLPDSVFYPPDVAQSGVDLSALIVVRVPGAREAGRAADRLLRSGAFGLVVLDFGPADVGRGAAPLSMPMQGRLVGLAQRHDAALVCVTHKSSEAPSIGSMVSLRAEPGRTGLDGDRFRCRLDVIKDKKNGPGWSSAEVVRGPAGMC